MDNNNMENMNQPLLSYDEESSSGGDLNLMGSMKKAVKSVKNKLLPAVHAHVGVSDTKGNIRPMTIDNMRLITNNFSADNILGQGGSGTVYKGQIRSIVVAMKRMHCRSASEFESQLAVLKHVRHQQHLVSLLCYVKEKEKIFVYEYMPQGSLGRHLFDWEAQGLEPLEWDRRLVIALDVARAVDYLHTFSHVHGNLKPSNILFGNDMRAKIADFGLALHGRSSGVFGYFAPECTSATGGVTTKVDVYSFGVILMELITGRKAFDNSKPEDSMHLVPWFRSMYVAQDSFCTVIDHTIINEESLASVQTVADLAVQCTGWEPDQRLDMSSVVTLLSSLVE